MKNWTGEQKQAIMENGDILVSAGAGSGKTAVLTERMVRLVREGADISAILCVTFTNAAAAEMKDRIGKALAKAAEDARGEEEALRLHEAARGVNRAAISTLHSFCTQVLRRHFNEAGLDPAFRVADAGEAEILRADVWDELCEARYEREESGLFARLMDALGDDERAKDAVLSLYDFARSQPEPFLWLEEALARYTVTGQELMASPAAEALFQRARLVLAAECDRMRGARALLGPEQAKTAAFLDGELMALRGLLLPDTPAGLQAALAAFAFTGRISWKDVPEETKQAVDGRRKAMRKAVKDLAEAWKPDGQSEAAALLEQRPLMETLVSVLKEFEERFAKKKSEVSVIDYGDMEHMCLGLLGREEIAGEYRRRFAYVFMDEYQDCSPVQEEILRAVSTPGSLFLVGDVKQSIYRFRLAEPRLFLNRYLLYGQGEGKGRRRIDLNANFRSARPVLDAVNGFFTRLMHESTGELEYDSAAALRFGRGDDPGQGNRVEFALIDLVSGWETGGPISEEETKMEGEGPDDDDLAWEEQTKTRGDSPEGDSPEGPEAEAAYAARRIRELMATLRLPDGEGKTRPAQYSDFVVLLRSYQGVAETWMQTLSFAGIPAYAQVAGGYFDAVEVRVFLELLRCIDNARQDIPLAAALRSPIGGFDTEELIRLRAEHPAPEGREKSWALVDQMTCAAGENTPLGQKAGEFLCRLARWKKQARLMSVEALIGLLLDETDYGSYARALPGGRQREANLEALCEKARQCGRMGACSLHDFLVYMEKLHNANASGAPQTAGANVVRVMSIHASKGLEFPVVILGGLGRRFSGQADREPVLFDGDLGFAARFTEGGVKSASYYTRAIAARAKAKAVAEELRVLYVAMTRAKEHLVMLAATPRAKALVERAALPRSEAAVALETSFDQWILGCLIHAKAGDPIRARYGLPPYEGEAEGEAEAVMHGQLMLPVDAQALPAALGSLLDRRMERGAYALFCKEAMGEPLTESLALPTADYAFFHRSYAYESAVDIPSKVSVTGLAGHEITMAEGPDFLLEKRMLPTDRGTAAHEVMRLLPLLPHTRQSVERELASLEEKGLLTQAQAEAVDPDALAKFFTSPLGERLQASPLVRRELEFNLRIPAGELMDTPSQEPILLQGVIDCCFMEGGQWVLLDYKTDRVPPGEPPARVAGRHMRQLALYAKALERLTGTPVKESWVHLLSVGKSICLIGEKTDG